LRFPKVNYLSDSTTSNYVGLPPKPLPRLRKSFYSLGESYRIIM